jgi:putative Mn2+ efflux pump MntP
MNKWKTAFWISFILLAFVSVFSIYSILDQAVTLTYQRDSHEDVENDLNVLSVIINETNLSKTQILKVLKNHHLYIYLDVKKDSVSLDRLTLVFKNGKLIKVAN